MAGPTTSVLISTPFSDELISSIYSIIDTYSGDRENDDFNISGSIASSTNNELWPFGVGFSEITLDYYKYSEDEITRIKAIVGFEPKFDIGLYAMCNNIESHKILGLLCLKIAEATNGIIDFGGMLEIKLPIHAGKLYSIPYELARGGIGYYNIGDVGFLKNWLEHENFRMIK